MPSNSPAVRAAMKKQQLKRLEAKAKPVKKGEESSYPSFYANMPFQKVRAEQNEKFRYAKQALRDAQETFDVAEISGDEMEEARTALAVAALVAERSQPGRRGSSASLTGA